MSEHNTSKAVFEGVFVSDGLASPYCEVTIVPLIPYRQIPSQKYISQCKRKYYRFVRIKQA